MKDKHLWVGYLTLSSKKVLVVSDDRVEAANSKNMLLYNQERDEIVEYSREIIQPKLKAAPDGDYDTGALATAYQKALRKKFPNLYRVIFTPAAGGSAVPKEKKPAARVESDDAMFDELEGGLEMEIDESGDDDEDDDFQERD